jgi:CelD/BcsL family acetyltransferase involved in cellulose biosynthesis
MYVPIADFTTDVIRPSELDTATIEAWHAMMKETTFLQRGFFAPEFTLACERAHDLARVVVFRNKQMPIAFFPFQFASRWHRMTGAGEQIGGHMSNHAGLIASPGFCIEPQLLLAAARLKALFVTDLHEGQATFGLTGQSSRIGHIMDLRDGGEHYLQDLSHSRGHFLQDTRRRLRRARKEFGSIEFVFDSAPTLAQVRDLIDAKRDQYARTGAGDVFSNSVFSTIVESIFEHSSIHCRPVISVLRAGDRVLARHLGLMSQGVFSGWFPVYDPAAKEFSPGRLLLWHMINEAAEHGITLIDRGEGDSRAKRDFSNGTQRFDKAYWYRGGVTAMPARAQFSLQWRLHALNQQSAD